MTPLIIIGALLLIIVIVVIIIMLPCSVIVEYSDDIYLFFKILFFKIDLFEEEEKIIIRKRRMTRKQAEKFEKTLEQSKTNNKKKKTQQPKQPSSTRNGFKIKRLKKGALSEILDTLGISIKISKNLLKHVFGYVRLKVSRINIKVASSDASTTALAYGAVCHAVSCFAALFENSKRAKGFDDSHINISCDYLTDTPTADIKLVFSVHLWQLVSIFLALVKDLTNEKLEAFEKAEQGKNHTAPKKANK